VSEFVGYVGPAEVHDAVVASVDRGSDRLVVVVHPVDSGPRGLRFEFTEPSVVSEERPVGMTLYSLSEMQGEGGRRRFVFVNWDEEDEACLELDASDVRWSEIAV
jgi:hypothetical protein